MITGKGEALTVIIRVTVTHARLAGRATLSGISDEWPVVSANLKLLTQPTTLPKVLHQPTVHQPPGAEHLRAVHVGREIDRRRGLQRGAHNAVPFRRLQQPLDLVFIRICLEVNGDPDRGVADGRLAIDG